MQLTRVLRFAGVLAEKGEFYSVKTRNGETLKSHPAAALLSQATTQARALLASFGLSPADGARVQLIPKPPKPSPFEDWS